MLAEALAGVAKALVGGLGAVAAADQVMSMWGVGCPTPPLPWFHE